MFVIKIISTKNTFSFLKQLIQKENVVKHLKKTLDVKIGLFKNPGFNSCYFKVNLLA